MLTNAQSIQSIIGTDHVTFNTTGPVGAPQGIGGQHLRVTFNGKNPPPGGTSPTDAFSSLYTNSGTANSISQLFYNNQSGIFLISAIRAFAYCDGAGNILGSQSLNVAGNPILSAGPPVSYAVTLTANAVTTNNYLVLSSYQKVGLINFIPKYVITAGPGTFNVTFTQLGGVATTPDSFAFIVLQI
jgi:hypothetical protein